MTLTTHLGVAQNLRLGKKRRFFRAPLLADAHFLSHNHLDHQTAKLLFSRKASLPSQIRLSKVDLFVSRKDSSFGPRQNWLVREIDDLPFKTMAFLWVIPAHSLPVKPASSASFPLF